MDIRRNTSVVSVSLVIALLLVGVYFTPITARGSDTLEQKKYSNTAFKDRSDLAAPLHKNSKTPDHPTEYCREHDTSAGMYASMEQIYPHFFTYTGQGILLLILFLTASFLWIRMLQKKVARTTHALWKSREYKIQETLRQSEERFQRAMEANQDGIWDWNIATGETYYSPAYAAMLGYGTTGVPSHVDTWRDLIHPDDREKTVRANHDCIENLCDSFTVKFRMQAKNGDWRWILGRGKAFSRDSQGHATRLAGTHTDITDIKETEEALIGQNLRYATLLTNLNGMVYRCENDTNWTMDFVSNGCLELTGYPSADLLGNSKIAFNTLILPEYRSVLWDTWQKNLAAHEPVEVEYEIRTASGKTKWVWEKGCGFFDKDGRLMHLEGFITDISERKQLEHAMEKRIVALTRPLEDAENITFEELFNLDDIQQLQDEVAEAVGLASVISRPDGTPITRPSNFCRLCKDIIRKAERGRACCQESDKALGHVNTEGPRLQPCKTCGLWDAGASISVGGTHIATWLIGQVRDATQTEEMIRAHARSIGADEEDFLKAFFETPAMSHTKFEQIAQTIFTLANQLSLSAYQNIQQARFIAERNQAIKELHRSEENLRTTLDSIGDGVIATDTKGRVTRMNPVAEKLTGWSLKEALDKPMDTIFTSVHAHTREAAKSPVHKVLSSEKNADKPTHTVLIAKDGTEHHIADSGAPIRSSTGTTIGVVLVFRDVTEEYILQQQLRQSQKMDAIGQLAGGVAHDFNNMLSGIMGAAELLKSQTTHPGGTRNTYIDLILQTATRAAELTSKLLAFGRKGKMTSTTLDIHELMDDTMSILASTLDKKIRISVVRNAKIFFVCGDASALQNAFLNLGINAGQAMPEGGEIHIGTCNRHLDEAYCNANAFAIKPGDYIEIEIRDTGTGISPACLDRIYEPFFTTKTPGKGTGLGLAAVYGTVQDHHGEISVSSELGAGTSFHILLPCMECPLPAPHSSEKIIAGTGHILLVDDEEYIRMTEKLLLEDMGYRVLLASDGREAVEIFQKNHENIDIVIMDMMMPEMDGYEACQKMKEIDTNCKVIITSGFTDNTPLGESSQAEVAGFIRKPYKISELSQLIAQILGR